MDTREMSLDQSHLSFLVGVLVGVVMHHGLFIHGEWHKLSPNLFTSHALSVFLLILGSYVHSTKIVKVVSTVQMIFLGYVVALMMSIVLYRAFFHRLTRYGFKGPWYARVTKLWHPWAARDAKNHLLLATLHETYGDFVRTGPSELTVFHPEIFLAIDGPRTECTKGEWYDILYPSMQSIVTTRDKRTHAIRRRQWAGAFSPKALAQYNQLFLKHLEILEEHIEFSIRSKRSCEMQDLLMWFSFDAMGDLIFDTSFNMLRNRQWHPVVNHVKNGLHLIGLLSSIPWLTHIGFRLSPRIGMLRRWYELVDYCRDHIQRHSRDENWGTSASNFMHYMLKQEAKIDNGGPSWLEGDTLFFIVAGSEPLGNALHFILYNLASHPRHAEIINKEIANINIDDDTSLSKVPHLNAVINESSRLSPSVLTAGSRKTGKRGITVGTNYIPPNTTIVAPRYSIFRREDCFEQADQFIPERWSTRPEMIYNATAFVPFGIGQYSCLGRTLSLQVLRRVIARLIKKYEFHFAPGENGQRVYGDLVDHISSTPGQLELDFNFRLQT